MGGQLKSFLPMSHKTVPNRIDLDALAWKILEALQQNARISFAELGRKIGLSTPAVAERVHRLEEAGVITGYHASLDSTKLGVPIRVNSARSAVATASPDRNRSLSKPMWSPSATSRHSSIGCRHWERLRHRPFCLRRLSGVTTSRSRSRDSRSSFSSCVSSSAFRSRPR